VVWCSVVLNIQGCKCTCSFEYSHLFQCVLLLAVDLGGATGAFSNTCIKPCLHILVHCRGSDCLHVVCGRAVIRNAIGGHIRNIGGCSSSASSCASATASIALVASSPTASVLLPITFVMVSATAPASASASKSATFNSVFATFTPAHFCQLVLQEVRFLLCQLR